jgi:hypothetical protein
MVKPKTANLKSDKYNARCLESCLSNTEHYYNVYGLVEFAHAFEQIAE